MGRLFTTVQWLFSDFLENFSRAMQDAVPCFFVASNGTEVRWRFSQCARINRYPLFMRSHFPWKSGTLWMSNPQLKTHHRQKPLRTKPHPQDMRDAHPHYLSPSRATQKTETVSPHNWTDDFAAFRCPHSNFPYISTHSSPLWMKIQPKNGIFHYTPHNSPYSTELRDPYPFQKTVSVPAYTAHSIQVKNNRAIMWSTGCTFYTHTHTHIEKCISFLLQTIGNISHKRHTQTQKMNQILLLFCVYVYKTGVNVAHTHTKQENVMDIKCLRLEIT